METTGIQEPHEPWRKLWAKSEPPHPLWKHLLDTAAVSLALRNPLAHDGWTPESLAWIVGLHDVGKADPCFQHQERETAAVLEQKLREHVAAKGSQAGAKRLRAQIAAAERSREVSAAGYPPTGDARFRHERFSAQLTRQLLRDASGDEYYASAVARAVVAHHGHWEESARPSPAKYEEAQKHLVRLLHGCLGTPQLPATKPSDLSAFGMRLAGHVVLCDWIASNEAFFNRPELRTREAPAEYFAQAKAVAKEMVQRLDLALDQGAGKPTEVVDDPRPLQDALLDARLAPGLVVIEAPMGEGKTEAAWILAEQWRDQAYGGVYMALPTQATGDAIFERYERDYLTKLGREGKVHLIHGMAWLRDDREPDEGFVTSDEPDDGFAAQWFRPTRRAMLAAHGAGTVDQFLLAGLKARFGFLRLYGLDHRVLVVDEVHAYDAYMTAILARGLEWCATMRIPVVLLSATLSSGQRAQLLEAYGAKEPDPGPEAPYPLITHVAPEGAVSALTPPAVATRTLRLIPCLGLLGDAIGTARLAEQLTDEEKCVCVIVNTVRQAQQVYEALSLGDAEKDLFHARFTAAEREAIAQGVIAKFGKKSSTRPKRYVLVATQVVEQSLDVDFDEMISEIAPIDLLLQRSGRLHRHCTRTYGSQLHVLLPTAGDFRFGGTERVYDRFVLLRTLALLSRRLEVVLPGAFRPLVEAVYGAGTIENGVVPDREFVDAKAKWMSGIAEMIAAASPFLLNPPKARLFRPVGSNDPLGDDSDDGNGWRAKTRLGANDRTCLFVLERNLWRTQEGHFPMHVVRELYRGTVRVPSYVRLEEPAAGFGAAVEAKGALRGLTLIPCDQSKEWRGVSHNLKYTDRLGLVVEKA